ncbi:MAG TPA: glycosyltransferase family 87 protein [Chloroflexia bacterium]|nr:glycosyltransferase family 87 protein [Chloroflexia bacterium]
MRDNSSFVLRPWAIPHSAFTLAGWLFSAIGIGGYLYWAANGGLVRDGNWIALDFHVYYQASRVLGRGEDLYLAGISPPYIYPPLLAILVLPLSALHVTTATIIWKLLQHVCLIAAGWLLVRLLPKTVRPLVAGVFFLGWLTTPLQTEIKVGQVNSLILLLIAGALYLILRQREGPGTSVDSASTESIGVNASMVVPTARSSLYIFAGLLLALAVSIKVLPVLLVAYLWWRGPRIVAAVASGGVIALQLICLLVTPATARFWFEVFPGLFGEDFHSPDNQSLNATISRALLPSDPFTPNTQLLDGVTVRSIVTWLANLLVLAVVAWVIWASSKRAPHVSREGRIVRTLLEVSLVLLAIHLVSGSTWPHHLVLLSIPVTALLGAWWLNQETSDPRTSRWNTLWVALTLAIGLILLLRTPEEWLLLSGTLAPQSPALSLIASSVGTLTIIGWGAAIAVMLLRNVKRDA